ncbi:MAG: DUF3870 domain-containing protein [bacterium]|nr:DUF3870 domain-containing protein [bacterium]
MEKKTFLFGGYSQFPQGTPGHEIFKYFGIGFEVDPESGEIIDVSSTFLTELSSRFLRSVFVGRNIQEGGVSEGVREFEARYFCKGKRTIVAAILEAEKSYLNYSKQ